ncbi:MAG: hypothetical protein V7K90_07325 [Nostoc sp.]
MQPAVGIALTVRYINEIERTIFMRVIPTAGGAIALFSNFASPIITSQ